MPKAKDFKSSKEADVYNTFVRAIVQRCTLAAWSLPILLRDFHIQTVSVHRHLPFYTEVAQDLVRQVQQHDVVFVKTGTGTGKSTLMPLILLSANLTLAGGRPIRRIAVTQPRRFAADSIHDNLSKSYGEALVGFDMAGRRKNALARIVYYTDGLLRHMIHPDRCPLPFDIIII